MGVIEAIKQNQQTVSYIYNKVKEAGLNPIIAVAQAYVESGFNPNAVGPYREKGIFQFLDSTWREFGTGDPRQIENSTEAYIKFMRFILSRRANGDYREAVRMYNAGPWSRTGGEAYRDKVLSVADQIQKSGIFSEPPTSSPQAKNIIIPVIAGLLVLYILNHK